MEFKIGDRVKIKEDLSCKHIYKMNIVKEMERYKGKVAEIVAVRCKTGYALDIDKGYWNWSDDTFELVESKKFTKSDLKDGDIVTYRDGSKGIKNGAHLQKIGNSAIFASLLDYTEKLKQKENRYKNLDIIKVERPVKYVTAFERVEEILDEAEKEYLKAVIKPFRKKIKYIQKTKIFMENEAYIEIATKDDDTACLPSFDQDKMYKGMEVDKKYSLEELGL